MTSTNYPDPPETARLTEDVGPQDPTVSYETQGTAGSYDIGSEPLYEGSEPSQSAGSSGGAKEQAKQAAGTAADESKHVAGVAQDEAKNVAGEAKNQAMRVVDEAKSQLDDHSRNQRDRLVETMRSFGNDLDRMADQSDGGMASDLVRQVAGRARDLTDRLDGREPSQILDDVRDMARRRPGAFLLGALAAGVVAGRLARGAKNAQSDDAQSNGSDAGYADTSAVEYSDTAYVQTSYAETGPPPQGYAGPPQGYADPSQGYPGGADQAYTGQPMPAGAGMSEDPVGPRGSDPGWSDETRVEGRP
jgi:hypothetical protein